MTATEQAIAALRAAARFADLVAETSGDEEAIRLHLYPARAFTSRLTIETSGDEEAIRLHRQCTEAIGALREESEREAGRERQMALAA